FRQSPLSPRGLVCIARAELGQRLLPALRGVQADEPLVLRLGAGQPAPAFRSAGALSATAATRMAAGERPHRASALSAASASASAVSLSPRQSACSASSPRAMY